LFFQQARSRATLAALGIPLWGVRREQAQSVPVISIWGRDDHENHIPNQISKPEQTIIVSNASLKNIETSRVLEQSFVQSTNISIPIESNSLIKLGTEVLPIEKFTRLPFIQTIATNEAIHVEQLIRFSLEARVIGEWVVLVSVQA
jgi:hypothetical protein